jgi:hypothetical protein
MRNAVFVRVLVSWTVSLVLVLGGLQTNAQRRRRTGQTPSGSVQQQAEQQAHAIWNARITKCGQDYFTMWGSSLIVQLKNLVISVDARSLRPADRLNGIEWLGRTTVTAGPSRTYKEGGQWSSWSNGMYFPELYVDMRKDKGHWSSAHGTGSNSAELKSIACGDVNNPTDFFRRRAVRAYNSAVIDFVTRATQRALYTHSIPADMWTALYKTSPIIGGNFTSNSYVYLAGNGGWRVCGPQNQGPQHQGCIESNLPKPGWAADLSNGTDLQIDAANPETVPRELLATLRMYRSSGLTIAMVRVGYRGEWFVKTELYTPANCVLCYSRQHWVWGGLADSAQATLQQLTGEGEQVECPIRDLVFSPNGGFVMLIDGRNSYLAEGIPPDAYQILVNLRASNQPINKVTFGPTGSWIILANSRW